MNKGTKAWVVVFALIAIAFGIFGFIKLNDVNTITDLHDALSKDYQNAQNELAEVKTALDDKTKELDETVAGKVADLEKSLAERDQQLVDMADANKKAVEDAVAAKEAEMNEALAGKDAEISQTAEAGMNAIRQALADKETELKTGFETEKAALQTSFEAEKAKLKATFDAERTALQDKVTELEAKVQELVEQLEKLPTTAGLPTAESAA